MKGKTESMKIIDEFPCFSCGNIVNVCETVDKKLCFVHVMPQCEAFMKDDYETKQKKARGS